MTFHTCMQRIMFKLGKTGLSLQIFIISLRVKLFKILSSSFLKWTVDYCYLESPHCSIAPLQDSYLLPLTLFPRQEIFLGLSSPLLPPPFSYRTSRCLLSTYLPVPSVLFHVPSSQHSFQTPLSSRTIPFFPLLTLHSPLLSKDICIPSHLFHSQEGGRQDSPICCPPHLHTSFFT